MRAFGRSNWLDVNDSKTKNKENCLKRVRYGEVTSKQLIVMS